MKRIIVIAVEVYTGLLAAVLVWLGTTLSQALSPRRRLYYVGLWLIQKGCLLEKEECLYKIDPRVGIVSPKRANEKYWYFDLLNPRIVPEPMPETALAAMKATLDEAFAAGAVFAPPQQPVPVEVSAEVLPPTRTPDPLLTEKEKEIAIEIPVENVLHWVAPDGHLEPVYARYEMGMIHYESGESFPARICPKGHVVMAPLSNGCSCGAEDVPEEEEEGEPSLAGAM